MRGHVLLLVCLVPLFVIGLVILAVAVATASAEIRHRHYDLAGGIDLVDAGMTQEQFGHYLMSYFEHLGNAVSVVSQSETEFIFIAQCNSKQRFVFAKRSRNGVPDEEVSNALCSAKALQIEEVTIVTNSVLSRQMDEQAKADGVTIWDHEKLIPLMGKANARQFAMSAIENHPV